MLKRSNTGEPIADHEAQGVRAYVAAIIHSKALDELEMLARGLLVRKLKVHYSKENGKESFLPSF